MQDRYSIAISHHMENEHLVYPRMCFLWTAFECSVRHSKFDIRWICSLKSFLCCKQQALWLFVVNTFDNQQPLILLLNGMKVVIYCVQCGIFSFSFHFFGKVWIFHFHVLVTQRLNNYTSLVDLLQETEYKAPLTGSMGNRKWKWLLLLLNCWPVETT